jgi:hypothetical protein
MLNPGNRLKNGYTVNSKGYYRYTAGRNRGKYLHRVLVTQLCLQQCYYTLDEQGWPILEGSYFTVDHVDHNRQNNCHCNLLLLQKEIHDACSWLSWRNK